MHGQGTAVVAYGTNLVEAPQRLDLARLKAEHGRGVLQGARCYDAFRQLGLAYGPTFQGLQEVFLGEEQVLARIALPAATSQETGGPGPLVLHPGLMDALLQASVGLTVDPSASLSVALDTPMVPFALQQLLCFQSLPFSPVTVCCVLRPLFLGHRLCLVFG